MGAALDRFVRSTFLLVAVLACASNLALSAQEAGTQPQETPPKTQPVSPKQEKPDGPAFSWRITVPSPLPVPSNSDIPITISAGPQDATEIKVQSVQLFEKVLGSPTPELELRDPEKDGAKRFKVAAGQTRTFYLAPKSSTDTMVGPISQGAEFIGSAVITAKQKLEGEEIKLDVVMTTGWAQFLGFFVLSAGVFIGSFLVPVLPDPGTGGENVTFRTLPSRIWALRDLPKSQPIAQNAEAETLAVINRLIAFQQPQDQDETRRVAKEAMRDLRGATDVWQKAGVSLTKLQARFLVNVTSIAIGVNTLILTNNFGTIKDYVTCLLWGFGAPIGSKAITSLVALATGTGAPAV